MPYDQMTTKIFDYFCLKCFVDDRPKLYTANR